MSIRAGLAGCVALASCTFHAGTYTPGEQTLTIVDDTAADFEHGTIDNIAVDALGMLAPDAFIIGGLHARAYGMSGLTATMSWQELSQLDLGPILGERYGELPVTNWGTDRPYNLGLTALHADNFTVLYDGEIYLPAGRTTFEVVADDAGLFEIDLGTIKAAAHSVFSDGSNGTTLTVTAPHDGWYPVHAAVSENFGNAVFIVATVDNNLPQAIAKDRYRARVTTAAGLFVSSTDDRVFRDTFIASAIDPALVARDFTNVVPYDFGGIGLGNYGLRYTGQLRIDQSNVYFFYLALDSDSTDYIRLLIDDVPVAGNWPGGTAKLTSDGIDLAPGWHDVLLDFSQLNGAASLQLSMGTATTGAAPIPAARLRPVRRTGLLASAKGLDTPIVDATDAATPGVSNIAFPIGAPAGAVVDFTDYFFWLTNEPRSDLQVKLVQPAGTDSPVLPVTPAFEGTFDEIAQRTTLAGMPATGTWQAVFTDTVHNAGGGATYYNDLMVNYHGGPGGPFAPTATYTSAPHPTEGAATIDAIRVTAKLDGATLAIAMRTGDPESIAQAPWVDVAPGSPPTVGASELVQYRLTVISDGWQFPTIDKVEIDYTAPAP